MSSIKALWLRYLEGQELAAEEQAALLAALEVDPDFAHECREEWCQHGALAGLLAAPSMDLVAAVGQEVQAVNQSNFQNTIESHDVRSSGSSGGSGSAGWLIPLITIGIVGGSLWWTSTNPTHQPLRQKIAFGATEQYPVDGWISAGGLRYTPETQMGWTTDQPRRLRRRDEGGEQANKADSGKSKTYYDIQQLVAFAGSSWFSDRWELDINPGTYRVTIVCGDYKDIQGPNLITVEGKPLFTGEHTAIGEFISKSTTVAVTDGRLTLDVGGATPLGPDQDPEIELHRTDTALVSLEIEAVK